MQSTGNSYSILKQYHINSNKKRRMFVTETENFIGQYITTLTDVEARFNCLGENKQAVLKCFQISTASTPGRRELPRSVYSWAARNMCTNLG